MNQALGSFANTLLISAAAIVTLIAALLPWAILIGVVGAGWWAALRKWGKPKPPPKA